MTALLVATWLVKLARLAYSRLASLCQLLQAHVSPARPQRCRSVAAPIGNHHPHSHKKPDWIKAEIIRLKASMPQAGCRTLATLCNRRYAASRKITIGKTYVSQVIRQHHYEIDILRRKLKHTPPRSIARNLIWGIDLTGKTDTHNKLHFIFGVIDHGSRVVLTLQALHNKSSRTLLTCLLDAIRRYGKPKIIRTDNEAIFTSRLFRYGLKLLGIRHKPSQPAHPWQNGRIERFFGTLKQKLDQWQVSSLAQLNQDLNTFNSWYNHVRPHQNLNGKTPAEAWNNTNPYSQAPKTEHWFEAWEGLLVGYYLRR